MASSSASSSSHCRKWKYDVFLSFRGEDTRKTFTSHLYEGLDRMRIVTFQDDKRLEHGSSISEELCKAIEESQFAIIIFSKNYASSGWCLDELAKIMKCKDDYGQTVIPVFHNVDPSTIRYQKKSFAEAFSKHETRYKDDAEGMRKVQGWRDALFAAANLSGHDIRNRIEAECIQQIVDQIFRYCKSTPLSSLQDVVGINTHLEKVLPLLDIETNDVRIVGIWGMGGVGKTTIARAIFSALFHQFNATCFLVDVKENEKRHGMHSLQNTLLSDLLRKKSEYVNNKEAGKDLMASLCWKRVLIVLDDIDHIDHLEYLAGDLGWFGKGSRIIVTTRDKHLLSVVYEVATLPDHEAMQVFSRHAFKKEVPDQGFEKLSQEVVNHAKGLPLALKVWGCFLHTRDIIDWENAIKQMKKTANSEIVEKLKISYDGLDALQQQMFLDIACFFRGYNKYFVMSILESCFGASIGLNVLIERSLVVIYGHTIEMHDLIQDMGKYIVNIQNIPGRRSRLWCSQDFETVMINNTGTETVEAIWIYDPPNIQISKKALKNMTMLRMLGIDQSYKCSVSCQYDTFKYLSNQLQCLIWTSYPWESLPDNFQPVRLVHLVLQYSKLCHLWRGTKNLEYLRKLDLGRSGRLIQTPDFTGTPNLEYLDLKGCSTLEKVHPSLGHCRKLIRLNLVECQRLERFPCVNVESLEYLGLRGCTNLEKFPEILGSMKSELEIDMESSGMGELPSSIFQYRTHITHLGLRRLENLVTLPNCICKLKSLVFLNVSMCSKLESLPEEIGDLENLEELHANFTLISRPPSSIVRLNKLKYLDFEKPKSKEGQGTAFFVFPPVNKGLCSLEVLNLRYCNLIGGRLQEDIRYLSSLKELHLRGTNLDRLPRTVAQLGALEVLDVAHCKRLRVLPELPPNVDTLWAECHVAPSIQSYQNLRFLVFTDLSVTFDGSIDDLFSQTLFQCIFSLQNGLSASDSLSQRVLYMFHPASKIPMWFKYSSGLREVLPVKLPENWYKNGNFLGFAICYFGISDESTVELIPLPNDDKSEKLSKNLSVHSSVRNSSGVNFYFVPLASLWDMSKANGKTPNAYGHLKFFVNCRHMYEFGYRLLYKDERGGQGG